MAHLKIPTDLRALVCALPKRWLLDVAGVKAFIEEMAAAHPQWMLEPLTTDEAADMLGVAPGTLRNMRSKGDGPPGWDGSRYRSRLHVLQWLHDLEFEGVEA